MVINVKVDYVWKLFKNNTNKMIVYKVKYKL